MGWVLYLMYVFVTESGSQKAQGRPNVFSLGVEPCALRPLLSYVWGKNQAPEKYLYS